MGNGNADIEVVSEFIAESEQFRAELASMESAVDEAAANIDRTTAAVRVHADARLAQTALEQFVQSAEARGVNLKINVATPPSYAIPAPRSAPLPASVPVPFVVRPLASPVSSAPAQSPIGVALSAAIAAPHASSTPAVIPVAETPTTRAEPVPVAPPTIPAETLSRDPSPAPPVTHVVIPPAPPSTGREVSTVPAAAPVATAPLIPRTGPTPRPASVLPARPAEPIAPPEIDPVVHAPTSTPPVLPVAAPEVPRTFPAPIASEPLKSPVITEPTPRERAAQPLPPAIPTEPLSRDPLPPKAVGHVVVPSPPTPPATPPIVISSPETLPVPTEARYRPIAIPPTQSLTATPEPAPARPESPFHVTPDEPAPPAAPSPLREASPFFVVPPLPASRPPDALQKPAESPANARTPPAAAETRSEPAVIPVIADTSAAKADIERLREIPPAVVPVRSSPVAGNEPEEAENRFPAPSPIDLSHLSNERRRTVERRLEIARESGVAEEIFRRNVGDRETHQTIARAIEDKVPASAAHRPVDVVRDTLKAYGVPDIATEREAHGEYRQTYHLTPATPPREIPDVRPPPEETEFPAPAIPSAPPFTEPLRQVSATPAAAAQGSFAGVEKEMAGLFTAFRRQLEETAGIIKGMASDVARATRRPAGGGGDGGSASAGGRPRRGPSNQASATATPSASPPPGQPPEGPEEEGEDEDGGRKKSIFKAGRVGQYLTAGFAIQSAIQLFNAERQHNLDTIAAAGDPRKQAEADLGEFGRLPFIAQLIRDPGGENEFTIKETIRQADEDTQRAEHRRDLAQEVGHAQRTTAIAATGGVEREQLAAADRFKTGQENLQKRRTEEAQKIADQFRGKRALANLGGDREQADLNDIGRSHSGTIQDPAIESRRQANLAAIAVNEAKARKASDGAIKALEKDAADKKSIADRDSEAADRERQSQSDIRISGTKATGEEAGLRLEGKPVEAEKKEFERRFDEESASLRAKGQADFDTGNITEARRIGQELIARRDAKPDIIAQNASQLDTQEHLKDIASQHEVAQTTATADEELRRAQGDIGGSAQSTLERENADRVKRLNEEAEALQKTNAAEAARITGLAKAEQSAGEVRKQALTTRQVVQQREAVSDIGVATQASQLRAAGRGAEARELEADQPFQERKRELHKDTTKHDEEDALIHQEEAARAERQAERHEGATRVRAQARETELRTDRKPFSAELAGIEERNRERLREVGGDAEGTAAQRELHRQELREFLKPKPEGGGQGSLLDRANALQASVFSAFGKDAVNARRDAQRELSNTNRRYARDADHALSSEKSDQGGWGPQSNSGKTGESLSKAAKDLQEAVAKANDLVNYFGAVGIA